MQLDLQLKTFKSEVPKRFKRPAWDLAFPVSTDWDDQKRRVLFVIDHVQTQDLKARHLLSEDTQPMFINVLDQAWKIAKDWGCKRRMSDFGYAWVNFNYFKTYDLPYDQQKDAQEECKKRLQAIIKKLKPTHIHFFGDEVASVCYDIPMYRRGRLKKANDLIVSSNISITSEAKRDVEVGSGDDDDFDDDYEDYASLSIDRANLLGFACENLARLFNGGYPFSLKDLKVNYKLIRTMKEWKELLAKLHEAKAFAVDTETFNLTATQNGVVSIQFSLDETLSYIIPLKHMDAPWKPEQLKEILWDLREFFGKEVDHYKWDTPLMIGQNLSFDMRVLRVELGLPIIHYRVWDVMAANHALNENLKALNTVNVSNVEKNEKAKPWALDTILSRYENDFYYRAEFSKEDRAFFKDVHLTEGPLRYAAMDTQAPFAIHKMQLKQAALLEVDGENWRKPFRKIVTGVYSDTIHTMSEMMENGVQADRDYIIKQHAKETSDVDAERQRLVQELYQLPSVQRANRKLLKKMALSTTSLLGDDDVWAFDIDTREHQQLLFFKVLGLEPIERTKKGEPSVGKAFLSFYTKEDSNHCYEEVKLFKSINESKKVRGYIKAYFEKLSQPDGQHDSRIRASYGFVMVVTGRSNSFDPSFQQVPTHGSYAKIVKRAFVAGMKRLIIKMDYAAHEVRCWAILALDYALAKTFQRIWNLWVEYRKDPTPEKWEIIKVNDAHKVNYSAFTGTPVEKVTKPQRQESKVITFGVMYGKSIRSLALEIGKEFDEAKKIYDNFFRKFKKGRQYLDDTVKRARDRLYTFNPFKYRRNLPGHLAGDQGLSAAMDRRAQNSPVQGFASQLGFVAARLLRVKLHSVFVKYGVYGEPVWDEKLARWTQTKPPVNLNAMVHDSTEVEVSYEYAPMMVRAMEHCATTGVMDYTTKMYGIEYPVRLQVDFEIGDHAAALEGWDYTKDKWKELIKNTFKSHKERGIKLRKEEASLALKPSPLMKKMMKHFPLDLSLYDLED